MLVNLTRFGIGTMTGFISVLSGSIVSDKNETIESRVRSGGYILIKDLANKERLTTSENEKWCKDNEGKKYGYSKGGVIAKYLSMCVLKNDIRSKLIARGYTFIGDDTQTQTQTQTINEKHKDSSYYKKFLGIDTTTTTTTTADSTKLLEACKKHYDFHADLSEDTFAFRSTVRYCTYDPSKQAAAK